MSADNVALPAAAAECRAAMDQYLLHAVPTAADCNGRMGQTDRQTDKQQMDRCHTVT